MKIIPCPRCQKAALGPATVGFPEGAPLVVGRFTSDRPLILKCFRCKRGFKLSSMQFHGLPEISPDERKSLGRQE